MNRKKIEKKVIYIYVYLFQSHIREGEIHMYAHTHIYISTYYKHLLLYIYSRKNL